MSSARTAPVARQRRLEHSTMLSPSRVTTPYSRIPERRLPSKSTKKIGCSVQDGISGEDIRDPLPAQTNRSQTKSVAQKVTEGTENEPNPFSVLSVSSCEFLGFLKPCSWLDPLPLAEIFVCFGVFVGNSTSVDLMPYHPFIAELAHTSGEFIRPFFGNPNLAVETKAD